MFHRRAFSLLLPDGWNVFGGLIWRDHPTMPGAVSLSLRSSDNLYVLNIYPAMPYFWSDMNPLSLFGQGFGGGNYLGNEIRQPVGNYLQYLQQFIFPGFGVPYSITDTRPLPDLENAMRQENPSAYGMRMTFSAGAADFAFSVGGLDFEGSAACGISYMTMMSGQLNWIADKIFVIQFPKNQRHVASPVINTILKSFKLDLEWYNEYCQYVQAATNNVMYGIYQAGVRSRIIANTSNQISEMNRISYERQQTSYDHVYRGISESIRGVHSYYDPFKGYSVEFPVDYRYVYANPLGQYYATNNPNDNPNYGTNAGWTILG